MNLSSGKIPLLLLICITISCKKEDKTGETINCFSNNLTTRQITNKRAVVKLTATATEPIYLVEEGTIDTRLLPCNLPMEFYQHNLSVTISGEVKATQQNGLAPCCAEDFVITKIAR
jgi:hypothetical protein